MLLPCMCTLTTQANRRDPLTANMPGWKPSHRQSCDKPPLTSCGAVLLEKGTDLPVAHECGKAEKHNTVGPLYKGHTTGTQLAVLYREVSLIQSVL